MPSLRTGRLAAAIRSAVLPGLLVCLSFTGAARAQEACQAGASLMADAEPALIERIEGEAAGVPNGEGRLFRIERDERPASFLFGTMHLSDPRVVALTAEAESAFAGARTLVIETTDLTDESRLAGLLLSRPDLTLLPPGTALEDLLPAERRAGLAAALEAQGVPAHSVTTLQPWFVTLALVAPPCEAQRSAAGETILDLRLAERASEDGKALVGLESAEEQMQALAALPQDLQALNLLATLDMIDRLPDLFETMIDLYLQGRIGAIRPALEGLAETRSDERTAAAYAAFEDRVILSRNRTMAERLAPTIEAGGVFVAVGALHLPGEEGLVELLRAQGWRVSRAD
ncbi:TraB/GumN family protein [Aureimonas populi]|uniref:TraB/GumN family protein n=1 Tax=Aureimonas populi TaxID=1701758 RepID=A0ABW5CRN1_9HYPH|nr:TraB/GumN family protein [Aureimonas populi]